MADHEWTRSTACKDAARRDKWVVVTISEDGHVVLTPPPGEAVVLTVSDVTSLRGALREAQIEAIHRRPVG